MIIDWISAIFILAGGWSMLKRFWTLGFLGFFVPQWWKKRRATTASKAASPAYQKYGHPFAPVPKLHEALPSPPMGHAWEISVESGTHDNGDETLWLVCRLMEIVSATLIAECKTDLIYEHHYTYRYTGAMSDIRTWSDWYMSGSETGNYTRAWDKLVGDTAKWAGKEKSKIERKDFVGGEFMIKGA